MQDIVNAISTVGFPIAMCLILLYEIKGMSESHKEETNALKDALNNNTIVLEKILTRLNIEKGENNVR